MKRLWVAVALLLICGVLSATEFVTAQKHCDYLKTALEKAESYISDKEFKEAVSFIENVQHEWESREKTLKIYLLHEEAENITEGLAELKEFAQEKKASEYMSVSKKTKRQLLRIKQSELPDLENIL